MADADVTVTPLGEAPASRADVAQQARLVGLKNFETPTLEAVERRRWQLWLVSVVILLGASALLAIASIWPELLDAIGMNGDGFSIDGFRVLMLLVAVVFSGYTIEKEGHLRRLTRLLIDERVLTAALSNRLTEVSALLEAGKAMNSVLELEAVLEIILNSATSLLEAEGGSIMLRDEDEEILRAVCVKGNQDAIGATARFDEGIAGRVAKTREPLLVTGHTPNRRKRTETALSVPLVHRDRLFGVLNVNATSARRFTEYDLRALALFAEQAASAIGNARLYETERVHVARLLEGELRKSEFLAAVSHDLRTPLTSLIGCTKLLQRDNLSREHRSELAEMVDRQADRLNTMIENLLTAARLESDTPPELEAIDLQSLLVELVDEFRMASKDIELVLPTTPVPAVAGRRDALHRVFANLIDNAFKHGAPPVTVTLRLTGTATRPAGDREVEVKVVDRGSGIPPEDRARVFERFWRLDENRGTPGIGLGLSIVQGLVASCGGTVQAEPGADDIGTVMRVRLRIAVKPEDALAN